MVSGSSLSCDEQGIDGFDIEVEATTIKGQQQMISIIGLGDQAVKEAGERIQAALEFCGYSIPKDKVIISLAPGNRRKRGSHYDLPMTIALLQQTDQICAKNMEQYALIGGGSFAQPGEVSLSHNGVLFLDELAEFSKSTLDALRQPLENRKVTISRVNGTNTYPANSANWMMKPRKH